MNDEYQNTGRRKVFFFILLTFFSSALVIWGVLAVIMWVLKN